MSDISLHFSPLELALIALILCSPGLIVGGLVGAFAWRRRWYWCAPGGAAVGAALCIGWFFLFGLK